MKQLIFFLLLFIWMNSLDAQAFIKGAGVRYDMGVPSLPPWSLDQSSELVIDVLTRKMYQWDRVNERWVLSSSNPQASYEAFDPNLTFTAPKYLQPYTASSEVIFTADTTNGSYGTYTIARIDFEEVPIQFSGAAFDSVQFYNIASGDTLSGIHMVYFEHTPYGVAVSVPSNIRVEQDTITGGGGGGSGSSPALAKAGGVVEFDGLEGLTEVDTLIQWVDQISGYIAQNPTAASKPAGIASGPLFTNVAGQYMSLDNPINLNGDLSITIAWNCTNALRPFSSFIGQTGDVTSFDLARRRWADGITAFKDMAITTPGDSLQLGPEVIQLSCVAATNTCEVWFDGVSIGTDVHTETFPQLYDMLGAYHVTDVSLGGTFYYLSVHNSPYTAQEQQDFFQYVNARFSLGL